MSDDALEPAALFDAGCLHWSQGNFTAAADCFEQLLANSTDGADQTAQIAGKPEENIGSNIVPQALGLLAQCFLDPLGKLGRPFDPPTAVELFRRGASLGDPVCQYGLARAKLGLLETGTGTGALVEGDVAKETSEREAVSLLRSAAGAGHRLAMVNLGVCLCTGRGVTESNAAEGAVWYRRAAVDDEDEEEEEQKTTVVPAGGANLLTLVDSVLAASTEGGTSGPVAAGRAEACINLGECYARGSGVPQSVAEAVSWFVRASQMGSADGLYNLARCVIDDAEVFLQPEGSREALNARATSLLNRAAALGHAAATYSLGLNAEAAGDEVEAFTRFRTAADLGLPAAMYNAGVCLAGGSGTVQDESAAADMFRRAAERNYSDAMFNLGVFLVNGVGVAADRDAARGWFVRAAELGNADAAAVLDQLWPR